jgi:hypothetical protein
VILFNASGTATSIWAYDLSPQQLADYELEEAKLRGNGELRRLWNK